MLKKYFPNTLHFGVGDAIFCQALVTEAIDFVL